MTRLSDTVLYDKTRKPHYSKTEYEEYVFDGNQLHTIYSADQARVLGSLIGTQNYINPLNVTD